MVSQLQVLSKILNTKDFSLVSLNNLTADKFFNYRNEFTYLKNHYETYKTVPDKLTFLKVFPDFEIQDVTEPDSYLLEQLNKDYNQAYLIKTFNGMKKLLETDQVEKAVDELKKAADGLQTTAAIKCTNLLTDTSRFDRYLDMAENRDKYFIRTGFKELDDIIYGIDVRNENMVIAARTGVGKSWTLLIMAAASARQGLTVGIYSGEMSVDKVGYRLDTLLGRGRLLNRAISHGDLSVRTAYEKYIKDLQANLDGWGAIKVLTPNDIAGPATVDALQAFIEREHIDILFVDQYSLLEDTSRTQVMHEKVANISKAIKNLQVMKQIPIVSVSQMNRTKADEKDKSVQDTTQIGLSDRIGQDATTVIMLSRAQVKDQASPGSIPQDRLILNIVKSRDGGDNRKLTYAADFNTGRFDFIPENISEEEAKAIEDDYSQDISGEGGVF